MKKKRKFHMLGNAGRKGHRRKRTTGWAWMLGLLLAIALVGCAGGKKLITSNGVHALQIGDPMPAVGTDRLRGHSVRDTFVEQGDYQWREVVMDYRKGRVYLEEDFFGSDQLARVRIYTPELSLRNGLRVGMAVTDLQAQASDWTLIPMPDYDLIEAYSRTMPRIHFLIDDPAVSKTGSWEDYKIEQLAPTAKIAMIVVF
jgi:hypothetical protein